MSIQTRLVEYCHDDLACEGMLAWDDSIAGARPGILVSHTIAGRAELEENKAKQLAELGYAAFALDLYGKEQRGNNLEQNRALMQSLLGDRPLLQVRLLNSLNVMRQQAEVDAGNVAAIGFCFGGLCVLDIARTGENLKGVVSFHGLFSAPGNTAENRIKAKVLVLHGWDDPMATPDHAVALASELSSMGADWQLHGYGNTMHAFTNPKANDPVKGTVYEATANARSWTAMTNFLAELFG